jgi:hypothetical protein
MDITLSHQKTFTLIQNLSNPAVFFINHLSTKKEDSNGRGQIINCGKFEGYKNLRASEVS